MENLDQEDKEAQQVPEGREDHVGQQENQVLRADPAVTGLLDHLGRED